MRFKVLVLLACASGHSFAAQEKDVKVFFQRTCAACHGPDGSGKAINGQRLPGRIFTDARWQTKEKDADLMKSILKGKGGMPSFQSQLSEAEAEKMVAEVIRPFAARKK